jgi:RNA recognition motif. (a.k.a. RRM, RBD, or RNP domain)
MTIKPPRFIFLRPVPHNRIGLLVSCLLSSASSASPPIPPTVPHRTVSHLVRFIYRSTTDESLRDFFSGHGQILDSIVMRDRETGRSRGFGFVTYAADNEAQSAIASLNDQELDGRRIKVNLANARSGGGGGGGSGYGGSGGGGGYNSGGYGGGGGGYQQQGAGYGGSSGYNQSGYGTSGGGYGGGYGKNLSHFFIVCFVISLTAIVCFQVALEAAIAALVEATVLKAMLPKVKVIMAVSCLIPSDFENIR